MDAVNDLLAIRRARLHIARRNPAANAARFEARANRVGNSFILGGVADEGVVCHDPAQRIVTSGFFYWASALEMGAWYGWFAPGLWALAWAGAALGRKSHSPQLCQHPPAECC